MHAFQILSCKMPVLVRCKRRARFGGVGWLVTKKCRKTDFLAVIQVLQNYRTWARHRNVTELLFAPTPLLPSPSALAPVGRAERKSRSLGPNPNRMGTILQENHDRGKCPPQPSRDRTISKCYFLSKGFGANRT